MDMLLRKCSKVCCGGQAEPIVIDYNHIFRDANKAIEVDPSYTKVNIKLKRIWCVYG